MRFFFFYIISVVFLACNSSSTESTLKEEITSSNLEQDSIPENVSFNDISQNIDTVGQIITMGCHHGDELTINPSDYNWFAVILDANDTRRLKEVKVKMESCHDDILDHEGEENTSKQIVVDGDENIQFLIGGNFGFKNRKLEKIKSFSQSIEIGKKHSYEFNNKTYSLMCSGTIVKSEYQVSYKNFKLIYSCDDISQVIYSEKLYSSESGSVFSIYLFEDLDGDGVPDLIFDTEMHYNLTGLTLFLSGKAEKGNLVRQVARHSTTGC